HGGNISAARVLFPGAPEPFLDLSTGINPFPYPLPPIDQQAFARLPEPDAVALLQEVAAGYYGAPSPAHVVAAPGTQSLLLPVMSLVKPGRVVILGPTYNEHARVAAAAGHQVVEITEVEAFRDANIVVVVNPNNPDGRLLGKDVMLALAERTRAARGLLVVDVAFVDAVGEEHSLAAEVAHGGIVGRRSFA